MNFHWPSFFLGYAAGAGTMLAANQLRPLLLELAAGAYRIADGVASRLAMGGEHLDDLLAEAKHRAHDRGTDRSSKQRHPAARRVPRRKSGRTLRAVPA